MRATVWLQMLWMPVPSRCDGHHKMVGSAPMSGHGTFCRANPAEQCPVSGGEFNRSVQHQLQSIGRGFEGQGLSRALIEPQSNAIEVGLGEAREIGSSREVLSQQAVGVLVAATLPWTARITEVNLHRWWQP